MRLNSRDATGTAAASPSSARNSRAFRARRIFRRADRDVALQIADRHLAHVLDRARWTRHPESTCAGAAAPAARRRPRARACPPARRSPPARSARPVPRTAPCRRRRAPGIRASTRSGARDRRARARPAPRRTSRASCRPRRARQPEPRTDQRAGVRRRLQRHDHLGLVRLGDQRRAQRLVRRRRPVALCARARPRPAASRVACSSRNCPSSGCAVRNDSR